MGKTIFSGSAAAITTPFKADMSIDYTAFEQLIEFQIANGTNAIVVCGTTGESTALTDSEHKRLIKYCVNKVGGRVPVIAGTGSNNTAHALDFSEFAKEVGADAHLQITPYYNRTTQQGIIDHFFYIADRVDLPMIVYNVPTRTGVNILPETYAKLSTHKNIVAAKEASSNLSALAKTINLCHDRLDIYCGDDALTIPMLSLGAKGVISVLANIMPMQTNEMCKLFFDGQIKQSAKMQTDLIGLINALFLDPNPIPVKAAQNLMGLHAGSPRIPLTEPTNKCLDELKKQMRKHNLIS